jgi:DNA helicase-2/ATP-dependent DNA helicase PcrA
MTATVPADAYDPSGLVRGQSRRADELVALIGEGLHPTDEQRKVIEAPVEPTLVVAGAGSGKTHVLALRLVFLLDHASRWAGGDLAPDEILCLTFTRKAAGEIAERVTGYLDRAYGVDPHRPQPAVSTYNAYASSLVTEHGLRIGVDPDSTVLTEAALWQMASRVAEDWVGDLAFDGTLSTAATAVSALASALADHGRNPTDLADYLGGLAATIDALPLGPRQRSKQVKAEVAAKFRSRASLAGLVERFLAAKQAGSFLDFSDQIALASDLAQLPAVRAIEHMRYKAVLLDEYQDTSPGQIDFLRGMFAGFVPVMAVGDPHQAIYGFRGASEGALAGFADDFGERTASSHGGMRLTLSVSWRNSTEVLRAANAVTEPLRQVTSVPVPVLSSGVDGKKRTRRNASRPAVVARVFRDSEEEASHLVTELLDRRSALASDARLPHPVVEAAILCRVRRQFPALVAALKRAGVDFQVVGLGGLLDTPVVVDLVALLEVAHDPSRGDSLMRLLTSQRMALGIRDIAALHDWAEELAGPREAREVEASIVDAMESPPAANWVSRDGRSLGETARERLARLRSLVDVVRTHTFLPVTELVSFTARAAHLDIESSIAGRATSRARGDTALDALVEAARVFSAGVEHATLGGFLAWLDAAHEREDGLDSPTEVPRAGAVQVMTVHASKGMEWDIVAIPGLSDGTFPHVTVTRGDNGPVYHSGGWLESARQLPWALRRDAQLLPAWGWDIAHDFAEFQASEREFRTAAGVHAVEEERRLFYVALTRARSDVILTASWVGTGVAVHPVSVFVRELVDAGIVSDEGWAVHPPEGNEGNESNERGDGDPGMPVEGVVGGAPAIVSWPSPPTPANEARMAFADEVAAAIARGAQEASGQLPYQRVIDAMLHEVLEREGAGESVPLPPHLGSTALVRIAQDRDGFARAVKRPIPREPAASARVGSEFHSWVEAYFNRPALLDPDDWLSAESDESNPPHSAPDDGGRLRESFLASEWAKRHPTAIEANVEIPVGGVILRCRIDAVFPAGDGLDKVTVVDWKTGRPPQDAIEREAREVQLAVYRLAWSAWRGIPLADVDALFVYVAAGEVARPKKLLNEEQIVSLLRGD